MTQSVNKKNNTLMNDQLQETITRDVNDQLQETITRDKMVR